MPLPPRTTSSPRAGADRVVAGAAVDPLAAPGADDDVRCAGVPVDDRDPGPPTIVAALPSHRSGGGSGAASGGPGGVTTVKILDAGVASWLPAGSIARTENVCAPTPSVAVCGELQGAKSPPSSAHAKVEPASSAENVKVGVGKVIRRPGPSSSVVAGAVASRLIETVSDALPPLLVAEQV